MDVYDCGICTEFSILLVDQTVGRGLWLKRNWFNDKHQWVALFYLLLLAGIWKVFLHRGK